MPSPRHEAYRNWLAEWIRAHADQPHIVAALERRADVLLVLWHMDLEPARPVLQRGYAHNPRGGNPWDPVLMLRCFLLALLVGQSGLNDWVDDLAGCSVLRALAGLPDEKRPGVGTFYDFMHRLHDGPIRRTCEHVERPSEVLRRRARTPKAQYVPRYKKKKQEPRRARGKRRAKEREAKSAPPEQQDAKLGTATELLIRSLDEAANLPNPADLLGRLSDILIDTAVMESARRGLLGDFHAMIAAGDGSTLRTGGSRHGKRTCDHSPRERCDCPRIFSDPDAAWGWDSHNEVYYFGHRFYEISVSTQGVDLPLGLRLDPANVSEQLTSLMTSEHIAKALRQRDPDAKVSTIINDAGHDGIASYRYHLSRGTTPVIPLKQDAPAVHPTRPDVHLSKRAIPLCPGQAEMAAWGTARPGRVLFICPAKAGWLERCPRAPEDAPGWRCRPNQKYGPTCAIKTDDNPRLFPPIPRNAKRHSQLYDLRTGTERSNSVKKQAFRLERARHRRSSFWSIRLHLMALLQHARAWVAGLDAWSLLDELLGHAAVPLDKAA